MNAPVVLVTATLMVAILLTASLLIATGTRGERGLRRSVERPAVQMRHAPPPRNGII
jgi:hypothetical protein